MGCAASAKADNPGSAPSKADKGLTAENGDFSRKRSHSVTRLEDISKEREKEDVCDEEMPEEVLLGEIFEFGDFSVPVSNKPIGGKRRSSITKQQPKTPNFGGRGRPGGTRPGGVAVARQDDRDTFVFGDFVVSLETELDDEIVQVFTGGKEEGAPDHKGGEIPPTPGTPVPRQLVEKHITAFKQYNLLGHSTRVKCIALAPNEGYYVSCSNEDAAIVMYDIFTGKEILSFFGHEDTIISACFSLDSKFLATTSRDNTMILWDAVIGQQISVFDHEKVVICSCFSRDGKFLVSGCQDKICRKWDIRKRREVLAYAEHEGIIVSISYAPDGEHICSAAADKTLKIWNATTGVTQRTLRGHKGIVLSCTYSQDGNQIVSNDESVLKVWDVNSGECLTNLDIHSHGQSAVGNKSGGHGYSGSRTAGKKLAWTLSTYAPGPFGYYIVAVCNDRVVHLFNPKTGDEVLALYSRAPVYCLSSGFNNKLAFGDSYGNIYVVVLK